MVVDALAPTSPGHQHPWYWLCKIGRFLSYQLPVLSQCGGLIQNVNTCLCYLWSNFLTRKELRTQNAAGFARSPRPRFTEYLVQQEPLGKFFISEMCSQSLTNEETLKNKSHLSYSSALWVLMADGTDIRQGIRRHIDDPCRVYRYILDSPLKV